jgi:PTH1 family peptidyl-tRNA hydrolase
MSIRDWLRTFSGMGAGSTGRPKMVVGLGNPGRRYARTRHNVGFWVVDTVADLLEVKFAAKKFKAELGRGEFEGKKLILLKPQRYMNRSGEVARAAIGFYKLGPADILVISDDMALEPGRMRIRAKGSAGGHNGLADIIRHLKSSDFARLRIGIGRPSVSGFSEGTAGESDVQPWEDYVLSEPTDQESKLLQECVQRAREAVLCWLTRGVEAAMNEYNG